MKQIEIISPKYGKFYVKVDDDDYERLIQYSWHIHHDRGLFYVGTTIYHKNTPSKKHFCITDKIHRMVLNAPPGTIVDHIDGDTLNNQKTNLRLVDSQQNSRNRKKIMMRGTKKSTSKFKGVHRQNKRWATKIQIGVFDTEEEAARAYDATAKMLWGEFARLNFNG